MNDYIFAYGSLMSEVNRKITGNSNISFPVKVKGIKRSWNICVPDDRNTAIGAIKDSNSYCTGILLEVSHDNLKNFDEREKTIGYKRVELNKNKITFSSKKLQELNGKIWVYITANPKIPTKMYPIVQSYLDVLITACLNVSNDFALQFLKTTHDWNYPWINDRKNPRYRRSIIHTNIKEIDNLLKKNLKEFENRK